MRSNLGAHGAGFGVPGQRSVSTGGDHHLDLAGLLEPDPPDAVLCALITQVGDFRARLPVPKRGHAQTTCRKTPAVFVEVNLLDMFLVAYELGDGL